MISEPFSAGLETMCAATSNAEGQTPLLPALWWWDDPVPRSAAANMAIDEWLLLRQPPVGSQTM